MGEDSNSNTQESMNYFPSSSKQLTDYYLQKINHKNEVHFKIRRNNEDYRKVERNVNDRLRLGSLNNYQEVQFANTEDSNSSRAGALGHKSSYLNNANGTNSYSYENREAPTSVSGQQFFNRRHMFS